MAVTRSVLKPLMGRRVEITKVGGALYVGYLTHIGVEGLTLSKVSIFNKYLGASTEEPLASRTVTYESIANIKEL